MTIHEPSLAELAALAAQQEDQSETKASVEFEREVPPAGPTFGRLVEYIELGKREQKPYQGKAKPDAEMVRLVIELLHPKKNIVEYEVEGEKKKRGMLVSFTIKKSFSDKAQFKKLFNAMVYGRDGIKHMAQMLGEPFLITVHHNEVEKDGKKITYVNLQKDGVWSIGAPQSFDPVTGDTTDLRPHIPANFAPLRLFLWDNPTKGTWDSLYIPGTKTVKDDKGVESEVSKNWLQEYIMSAKNYPGSALEIMLGGLNDLPASAKQEEKPAEQEKPAEEKKQAGGSDEALAALGLM